MNITTKSLALALAYGGLWAAAHAQTGSAPALGGSSPSALGTPSIVTPAPLRPERTDTTNDKQPRTFETAVPNAPRQPNEFQRFVFTTTGQALPLFGTSYFATSSIPHNFAPVERIPVPADYALGPGDELQLRGWGTVDIDLKVVVDRNGQISIPRVGTVGVAGIRAGEIESHLRQQIERVFKGFQLSVTLGQLRSIQVFVVGQAQHPGSYTLSSLSTLVNAIFASGGPAPNGSMRRVQLRRGGQTLAELDLYDFIVRGERGHDQRLQNGDVIVYQTAGPRVAVLGAVDTPAIFELKPTGGPASEVLALAGGSRAMADLQQALLERIEPAYPKAPRTVQNVNLQRAQELTLRDGDVLTVKAVAPQFANAVTLRGNVAEPLRYPHTPGMRISQLIPERDALITRDYHLRKNRLVQYLTAPKTAIDQSPNLPASPLTPGEARLPQQQNSPFQQDPTALTMRLLAEREPTDRNRSSLSQTERTVRNLVDEPNWEYATIERLDKDRITTRLLAFNLGRAVLNKDPEHDLLLEPGDVVTIFGTKDIRGPQARSSRLVRLEGEVDRPGVYQLQPGESLKGLVARAGGVTGQAYLFGTEFSREATRARQRDSLQDAIRRLEVSSSAAGARQAANLSGTDAAAAARLQAAEDEARRSQINRLRNLQPNGRIALELSPSIAKADELPDLPLEDGDAIMVPSRPGFVFAVGAVANENALLWRPGRTVKQYLAAAGVNPEADEDNIFVVRADGSVKHNRDRSGFWFSGGGQLQSLELAPGDTIVVPDLMNRETPWTAFVRGAKDWTQILSNFGIAAAAIKTLRN
jgi:protein involved in polysaccharide export with SLBB domain